ncbi:REP-associated tyrosine transposase [Endothiovibrio diazotrophicus]
MGRTRYRITLPDQPHFLTCTIVRWLPLFARPEAAALIFDSLGWLHARARLRLYGYVVMENHLHLVASAGDLSRELRAFKSFTARGVVELLQRKGERETLRLLRTVRAERLGDRDHQVWQEGSRPQLIQNAQMLRQKLEYIHYNPVRRGYVDDPVHWRYSSARVYAGEEGLLPVCRDW